MTPPLVSFRNFSVQRGGTTILRGLDADIPRGGITALIGLNGSGKSTLLRAVVGEFPYQGEMKFRCGHDHSIPQPKYVGYVPQRLAIDPRLPLTVRDFLGLALCRWPIFLGLGRKWEARFRQLLKPVGAEELLDVPVDGLSGGQLQRVLLALALDPHPELLLLDEPASGIDFKSLQSFYELIADINQRMQVTILLVSHDLSVVSKFATKVLCLRDGKIVCQGPPTEILTQPNLVETFGPELAIFNHQHG